MGKWMVGWMAKWKVGWTWARLLDLTPGMVLRSNVETREGTLILSVGHQLNEMNLEKLRNFERVVGIKEPILVEHMEPPPDPD